MQGKKERFEKRKEASPINQKISEILAVSHKAEPYVITFRHAGDNVATSSLGTLVGFFEIDVHDEDAAYVVNFLASVARKEYLANVRRGPVESFEAALHKANVALSELVKHGNVSWLGHLHGALAILVGSQVHFSVTGDGALFLHRDHAFRSISEGLATRESEPHPLKTFVEIASGDLFAGDRLLLLSPSVWTLFTPSDIERSLERFDNMAFEQFLRTALVNELGSAGAIFVACESAPRMETLAKHKTHTEPEPTLTNAFSEQSFRPKFIPPQSQTTPLPEATPQEFVDAKTGHIYVQGDETATAPVASPWKERGLVIWHHLSLMSHQWLQRTARFGRKAKKRVHLGGVIVGEQLGGAQRSAGRKMRSLTRRLRQWWLAQRMKKDAPLSSPAVPITTVPESSPLPTRPSQRITLSPPPQSSPEMPKAALGTKIQSWISKKHSVQPTSPATPPPPVPSSSQEWHTNIAAARERLARASVSLSEKTVAWGQFLWRRWQELTTPQKWLWPLGAVILLTLGTWWLFWNTPSSEDPVPVASPTIEAPAFPPTNEKQARLLAASKALAEFPSDEQVVTVVLLRDTPWAISERALVNLATSERFTAPEKISLAAAMDDLSTIFLLSENRVLRAFTPSNLRFSVNALPLPAGVQIDALETYLTYLYVLDQKSGRLYRFPRAEGGFGTPTSWFKQPVPLAATPVFAVDDSVALGQNDRLQNFSRGSATPSVFELPTNALKLTALALPRDRDTVYGLDAPAKRVVVWDDTGALLRQFFSAELAEATQLVVSTDEKTLYAATTSRVLRFDLSQ